MSTEKRGRGRPLGSGKDDRKVLEAVADMVAANLAMRPTTAMRRVAPKSTDADVRRFQAKWKEGSEDLLNAARERTEGKRLTGNVPARRSRPQGLGVSRDFGGMSQLVRDVLNGPAAQLAREMANSPAAQLAREMANSPAAQLAREMANSPALKAVRDLENSPTMRMMRDIENSPTMRMMRDIENSPTMRMMRDIENNPALRAVREQQEMIDRLKGFL